ncbi:MAG: hypothetical protein Ct9H300mP1_26830 [Planctomycetaceae bacterium]|nr:MAG: hypothetical protein Ct9H300mP1_26830 [Planctomycetaceae bacterium]
MPPGPVSGKGRLHAGGIAALRRRGLGPAFLDATNIDRLNIGEVKTIQLNWLQPHEGNIIDFLFRARPTRILPRRPLIPVPENPRPSFRLGGSRLCSRHDAFQQFPAVRCAWCPCYCSAGPAESKAQPRRKATGIRTTVRVELLTDRRGAPLAAQRWARAFEQFKVSLRIRRGIGGERTAVREKITGRNRQVTVIGKLDRSGRILVPGKSFSPGNPTALGTWLKELGTFGAKGNPNGQPAFGLSEGQFNSLFETLAQPVRSNLAGKPLTEGPSPAGPPRLAGS